MLGNEIDFFFFLILERDLSISVSSAIFLSKKKKKTIGIYKNILVKFVNNCRGSETKSNISSNLHMNNSTASPILIFSFELNKKDTK